MRSAAGDALFARVLLERRSWMGDGGWGTVDAMKCPGCASDMAMVELHSIEIDRCPACGGIVLDKGESETIDALGLAHVIEGGVSAAHVHAHPRTTVARCYECALDMISLRGAGDVEYDWCERCERLFFDRGELTTFDAFLDA